MYAPRAHQFVRLKGRSAAKTPLKPWWAYLVLLLRLISCPSCEKRKKKSCCLQSQNEGRLYSAQVQWSKLTQFWIAAPRFSAGTVLSCEKMCSKSRSRHRWQGLAMGGGGGGITSVRPGGDATTQNVTCHWVEGTTQWSRQTTAAVATTPIPSDVHTFSHWLLQWTGLTFVSGTHCVLVWWPVYLSIGMTWTLRLDGCVRSLRSVSLMRRLNRLHWTPQCHCYLSAHLGCNQLGVLIIYHEYPKWAYRPLGQLRSLAEQLCLSAAAPSLTPSPGHGPHICYGDQVSDCDT